MVSAGLWDERNNPKYRLTIAEEYQEDIK